MGVKISLKQSGRRRTTWTLREPIRRGPVGWLLNEPHGPHQDRLSTRAWQDIVSWQRYCQWLEGTDTEGRGQVSGGQAWRLFLGLGKDPLLFRYFVLLFAFAESCPEGVCPRETDTVNSVNKHQETVWAKQILNPLHSIISVYVWRVWFLFKLYSSRMVKRGLKTNRNIVKPTYTTGVMWSGFITKEIWTEGVFHNL